MSPESIAQAAVAIVTPLATLVGLFSRRRRLRSEIRDNLELAHQLAADSTLSQHTPVAGWLHGKIIIDVAKLTGQSLGTSKKPIQKGALVSYAIVAVTFGLWTYYIVRDGFVWYSVFPGIVSFLMIMAVLGSLTNREVPPDQLDALPPGATPLSNKSGAERVASLMTLAAAGLPDDRFDGTGTIGVAFRFLRAMREGHYEDGLMLADTNWLLCRIQSWIWNNPSLVDHDMSRMDALAESLMAERGPAEVWQAYVATETQTFREAWAAIDPDKMGAGSDRRRLAPHYDLVVLAPLGDTGGYFVSAATVVPNAMTFTLHHTSAGWLIANHLGGAPPQPGWPPAWWHTGDPTVDALPDEPA